MKKSLLSLLAANLIALLPKSPPKPTPQDLQEKDFKTSTQKLGLRFTEKIRDIFRGRWIKKA